MQTIPNATRRLAKTAAEDLATLERIAHTYSQVHARSMYHDLYRALTEEAGVDSRWAAQAAGAVFQPYATAGDTARRLVDHLIAVGRACQQVEQVYADNRDPARRTGAQVGHAMRENIDKYRRRHDFNVDA
jgi:hypothetical protein